MAVEIAPQLDYSLTGANSQRAFKLGLAEADWYQSAVRPATIRQLLERHEGPALHDTALLSLILLTTGCATVALWGTWWMVIPYAIYAVFYGTSSDSRGHECSHGLAGARANRLRRILT